MLLCIVMLKYPLQMLSGIYFQLIFLMGKTQQKSVTAQLFSAPEGTWLNASF